MAVEIITKSSVDYVLLPHRADWSNGSVPTTRRRWMTKLSTATTGAQDRAGMTPSPPETLSWTVTTLNEREESRLEARVIAASLSGKAAAPWFGRGMEIVTATAGASTVSVYSSPWIPGVGDWIIILAQTDNSEPVYDSKQVASVLGNTITITGTLSRTYPAGVFCYPVLFGDFASDTRQMWNGQVGSWSLSIETPTIFDPKDGVQVDGFQSVLAGVEPYTPKWGPYIQVDGYQTVVAGIENYSTPWVDGIQVEGLQTVIIVLET